MDRERTGIKERKKRRKIALISVGAVLAIAVAAMLATLDPAAPNVERDSVWFSTVQRGELVRQVRGPGTLVPADERWIAATTDALVERQLIKPGAAVQPDTVILEMSNPELSQTLQEAELELEAGLADHLALEVSLINRRFEGEARLAEIRAEYLGAKLQVEAEADLFDKNIVSRLDYERSKLAEEQLATRFDIEKRRVVQAEKSIDAELAASQARLERLRNVSVFAPGAGQRAHSACRHRGRAAGGAARARPARHDRHHAGARGAHRFAAGGTAYSRGPGQGSGAESAGRDRHP